MTIKHYIIGFVLSLLLTLLAYGIVVYEWVGTHAVAFLLVLALIQMVVQLIYFLHLDNEVKPRYKLVSFAFMAAILLIIVIGSLWVMEHLNYNMMDMSPDEKDAYMMGQKDKGF